MKKELFERVVESVKAHYSLNKDCILDREIKVKETDEYISVYFNSIYVTGVEQNEDGAYDVNKTFEKVQALFKEKGWKGEEVYNAYKDIISRNMMDELTKTGLSILYNKIKDKISISYFRVGYKHAYKKDRMYPVKKSIPLVCYSKHLYGFVPFRGVMQPRIFLGSMLMHHEYELIIKKALLGIDYMAGMGTSYRFYEGTKSEHDVIEKQLNVKIPAAIRKHLGVYDTRDLYLSLKDYNEINTICQFLSKTPVEIRPKRLAYILAKMMFGDSEHAWLIEDWMKDHIALGKKFSIKIKSAKRMQEEHRVMSRARILKGIKTIKPHKMYDDLFKDSGLDFEAVDTKERLLQESLEMDHCVATYAQKINAGGCAIFSFLHEGKRYTLEVDPSFYMVQLQGVRNSGAPQELRTRISNWLLGKRPVNAVKQPEHVQREIEWL